MYVSAKYLPDELGTPPAEPGKKPVEATDDRNQKWWLTEDNQTGDWLDYLAKGGTIDPAVIPPITKIEVDVERDRRIEGGFTFDGKRYQSREFDQDNISGAVQAANMAVQAGAQPGDLHWQSPDYEFVWIAEDNSLTPMDAQTVVRFGQTLMSHKQTHIFYARSIKDIEPIPMDYKEDHYWPA